MCGSVRYVVHSLGRCALLIYMNHPSTASLLSVVCVNLAGCAFFGREDRFPVKAVCLGSVIGVSELCVHSQ